MTNSSDVSVTVVVPSFNAERYLEEALTSLYAQTYQDFEVVIVDDGSTDATAELAKRFVDDRTRLVAKENGGCASARNAGVAEARGRYISFLDSDDYWAPEFLARAVGFLERNPDVCMVFSLLTVVDEEGTSSGLLKSHGRKRYQFADLVMENPIGSGSCSLIRREVLDAMAPFNESLPASSDCDMWLRMAHSYPFGIACLPAPLSFYRRHSAQITADWRRMAAAYNLVIAEARALDPETFDPLENAARGKKSRYFAYIAYENQEPRAAFRLLKESFGFAPLRFVTDPRAWALLGITLIQLALPEQAFVYVDRTLRRIRRQTVG